MKRSVNSSLQSLFSSYLNSLNPLMVCISWQLSLQKYRELQINKYNLLLSFLLILSDVLKKRGQTQHLKWLKQPRQMMSFLRKYTSFMQLCNDCSGKLFRQNLALCQSFLYYSIFYMDIWKKISSKSSFLVYYSISNHKNGYFRQWSRLILSHTHCMTDIVR